MKKGCDDEIRKKKSKLLPKSKKNITLKVIIIY